MSLPIYQHATRDADQKIADALNTRVKAEQKKARNKRQEAERRRLMTRTPCTMIGGGAYEEVDPRRFELLTSCLQNGLIFRHNGLDVDGGQPASDRD
ncbi:hypothetical protein GCM10010404_35110 [Nonomuraea africana]|uniref:Uncharacterized protein n=1 Tax=Nonomuraea africana TaxID=46171 RepID=A0ABR9KR29_9ACTN|nr:hypothetical protein [Nonomuraea africana]MBE1564481.1 hypothetical protein [Nonomuraea africana]